MYFFLILVLQVCSGACSEKVNTCSCCRDTAILQNLRKASEDGMCGGGRLERISRGHLVQPLAQSRPDIPGRSEWSKPFLKTGMWVRGSREAGTPGGEGSAVLQGCQSCPTMC